MNSPSPSSSEYKIWWGALTALALLVIFSVTAGFGWLLLQILTMLKPIIIPIVIAGILSYLLNPIVSWLSRKHLPRTGSVIAVFALFIFLVSGIILWVTPTMQRQGSVFLKNLPLYADHIQQLIISGSEALDRFMVIHHHPSSGPYENGWQTIHNYAVSLLNEGVSWLEQKIPTLVDNLGPLLQNSIGKLFGIVGSFISIILVPVLLFFFLLEGEEISLHWDRYLPLPPSPFRNEMASLLREINNYIIFFFRGQVLVSLIDGLLIAISLIVFVHLDFAPLVGLMMGILGVIPYAGVIISWVPAVLIAAAQYGDWWHPMVVTLIFLIVNNIDSIFIAPRIVGKSVGLHPITIIISVLGWSLILGGPLGALMAVPLSASLKVILRRYIWHQPITIKEGS